MKELKIVEYQDMYAAKLADMWNKSSENWGGYDTIKTEQDVINEARNSGDLNVYLAIDNEEIAGYCSFSEYRQDEGASYIPLLNVRPDYHGKKIGKELVLKAVDRAIDSEWPRLDLYTWPGNTKAVPLYKKCGFFWEDRDDTTHLMNFIPNVLKTEAVKEYFEVLDWYKDSKREIEVKRDGRKENGFEYFGYSWEKDNIVLNMEYERKGRGLRLIETNDYIIKAKVKEQKLVFGKNYKVYYEIKNKSGKNLDVEINGCDDKNIKFSLNEKINVTDSKVIEGEFFLGEIKEEQSIWRTHPCVSAHILINGKKAEFKVGIEPKFPIKLKMIVPDKLKFLNKISKGYIDIENSFNEDINIKFKLKNTQNIEFINENIDIFIKGKERASIEVEYKLNNYGFYEEDIDLFINLKDDEIKYTKKITSAFKGMHGKFYGEDEEYWMIFNGTYSVKLYKFDNDMEISNYNHSHYESVFLFPKLGMPYSLEFSKEKPENVEYMIEDEAVIMKAIYNSKDFNNIKLISVIKLYSNGNLENYYEVHNVSEAETSKDIYLSGNVYHNISDSYIPYDGKIIKIKGSDGSDISYWDPDKINENWLYSEGKLVNRGITWGNDFKLDFNNWYMSMSTNLGKIKGNDFIKTDSILLSWGSFNSWKEFRAFANSNNYLKDINPIEDLQFEVNNGNPFIKDEIKFNIKDYKKCNLEGKIKIKSEYDTIDKIKKEIETDNNEVNINIKNNKSKHSLDIIKIKLDLKSKKLTKRKAVFNVGGNAIEIKKYKENDLDIYEVDNGNIKIKASPDFSNCLYSIQYNENEWLDNSYPTPKPNAWWNPWSGGISFKPERLSYESALKEKREAEFVKMKDNYGNDWEGLKLSLIITENEKYKGLTINQYYLMLPNVPVLLTTTEIEQNTGKYFNEEKFVREVFVKSSNKLTDSYFNVVCEEKIYKCGESEHEIFSDLPLAYSGVDREDKMIILSTNEESVFSYAPIKANCNYSLVHISTPNNSKVFSPVDFIIFNKIDIESELLNDLRNIKL